MTLMSKICMAIAQVVREHTEEEILPGDLVSNILTTGCVFGKNQIGPENLLIQLANQMAIVADGDMAQVDWAIDNAKKSYAMFKENKDGALMYGVLTKIGGGGTTTNGGTKSN